VHVHFDAKYRVEDIQGLFGAEGAEDADDVADGLLVLREQGFRVFTRAQLRTELAAHAKGTGVAAWQASAGTDDDEHIYAIFKTRMDGDFKGQGWNADKVMREIEQFESDLRQKPVENLGRTSPNPRVLPLRGLLKARLAA